MNKEMMIEILKEDRCTKSEAEKFLKSGTTIFEDFEENFDKYMQEFKCGMTDEEDYENMVCEYRNMIETGVPVTDWGIVKLDGKTYYIMYAN